MVSEPKWMFSLGEGDVGSIISVDPGEYYTWVFGNLVVNSGICIGPIRGLSIRH